MNSNHQSYTLFILLCLPVLIKYGIVFNIFFLFTFSIYKWSKKEIIITIILINRHKDLNYCGKYVSNTTWNCHVAKNFFQIYVRNIFLCFASFKRKQWEFRFIVFQNNYFNISYSVKSLADKIRKIYVVTRQSISFKR